MATRVGPTIFCMVPLNRPSPKTRPGRCKHLLSVCHISHNTNRYRQTDDRRQTTCCAKGATEYGRPKSLNAPKAIGGRASPGPAGGAYNAPPDLLGFKSGDRDKGIGKREKHMIDRIRKLREGTEEERGGGMGEGTEEWDEIRWGSLQRSPRPPRWI